MKFGIGPRLGLLAAVLVAVATTLVGLLTVWNMCEVLLQHELLDLGNDTVLEGRRLIRPIRQMRTDLIELAGKPYAAAVADGGARATQQAREKLAEDIGRRIARSRPADPDARSLYLDFALIPAPGCTGVEGLRIAAGQEGSDRVGPLGPSDRARAALALDPQEVWYSDVEAADDRHPQTIRAAVPIYDPADEEGSGAVALLVVRLDLEPILGRLSHIPRLLTFVTDQTGRFLLHPLDANDPARPRTVAQEKALGTPASQLLTGGAKASQNFEDVGEALGSGVQLDDPYKFYYAEGKFTKADEVADGRAFWTTVDGVVEGLAKDHPEVRYGFGADTGMIRLASFEKGPLMEVVRAIGGSDEIAQAAARKKAGHLEWRGHWLLGGDAPVLCETFGIHLVKLPLDPTDPNRYLALATAASHEEIESDIWDAEGRVIALKIGATATSALLAMLCAWLMITRPLNRITRGTVRIARGDHDVELPVRSRSEIGVLARSFQRMVEQLRERSAELKERETRLRTVLDTAAEGIVGIDERGRVEGFNQAAERITGWPAAEILGKPYEILLGRDVKPRDGAIDQEMSSSSALPIGKLGSSTRETVGFRKDGSPYPMEVSVSEVHVGGRRVWTWILRDISERKRAEDAIRRLNDDLERRVRHRTAELSRVNEDLEAARIAAESANYRKSEFLATMSHELRTPLNAVIGYGEMLDEEPGAVAEEFRPDVRKIVGSGRHLLTLINDILDLSKLEAGKVELVAETFDVAKLIDDVVSTVEPLVKKNGNNLAVRVDPAAGSMHTDKTRVRQVLFNLLSNACKFTKQGAITLEVSRIRLDAGDRLGFDVTDSGIGMKPQVLAELFAPFRQADATISKDFGGTGLGLSITRKLCRLMGGDVSVASEFGKGSTFSVDLPAALPKPAEEPPKGDADDGAELVMAGDPAGGAPTVLVIDDDPVVRDLMRRQLSKEGYVVVTATTGEEGLRVARESRPDAVTLDVLLPGMDGWEVLAQFKADPHLADVPVIMLTMLDDSNMGFALGATDYLSKPIDRAQLARLLAKLREQTVGRSVLVVEDDESTRDLLKRTLEKIGWQVEVAENGRKGLERVARSRPSLILLDLMMPEVDGFEFVSRLRKNPDWRSIPVVVLTAMDVTPEERDRLNGGVEQILQKGHFDRDRLMREVCDLVDARATRRPAVRH